MAKKQVEDGAQVLDINFDEGMIGIKYITDVFDNR